MNTDSPAGVEERLTGMLQSLVKASNGLDRSLSLDEARANASCGDRLILRCASSRDGLVLAWNGQGCSLMQAGASLLVKVLAGKDWSSAREIVGAALAMARGEADSPASGLDGEQLMVFQAFSTKPNRRECLLLAWRAMWDFLQDDQFEKPSDD